MSFGPDTALSPHFKWREFWQHDGVRAPDSLFLAYRSLCVLYLEPVRRAFGVCTVHSGYRSPQYNASVGGAPRSVHRGDWRPTAVAADVSFKSGSPREWRESFDELGVGGLGLYATHVHVDSRRDRARW